MLPARLYLAIILLFQLHPLEDEETESRWGGGMSKCTRAVDTKLGPEPGLPGATFSALCSSNTKHSDRVWVITAPTVPNGR